MEQPTSPIPPAPAPHFSRRLVRTNGPLGGVCGGIGDYFNVDPTIVRLGAVAIALLSGPVVPVAYAAAWLIIPQGEQSPAYVAGPPMATSAAPSAPVDTVPEAPVADGPVADAPVDTVQS